VPTVPTLRNKLLNVYIYQLVSRGEKKLSVGTFFCPKSAVFVNKIAGLSKLFKKVPTKCLQCLHLGRNLLNLLRANFHEN